LQDFGNIRVEVQDSGVGLQHPDRVFETFFTTKQQGNGVWACRSAVPFIELHQGQLWPQSGEASGTTFCFTLPLPTPGASHEKRPTTVGRMCISRAGYRLSRLDAGPVHHAIGISIPPPEGPLKCLPHLLPTIGPGISRMRVYRTTQDGHWTLTRIVSHGDM